MWIARTGIDSPRTIFDIGTPSAGDDADAAKPSDRRRVLELSGGWSALGDSFQLEAILDIDAGKATGPIHWVSTRNPALAGVELVDGGMAGMSLTVHGIRVERGLACDRYRIVLNGDEQSGSFSGTSWAFGSWAGRLHGTYRFREEAPNAS